MDCEFVVCGLFTAASLCSLVKVAGVCTHHIKYLWRIDSLAVWESTGFLFPASGVRNGR